MKKILILSVILFIFGLSNSQVIHLKHKDNDIYFNTVLKEPIATHYLLNSKMLVNNITRTQFKQDPLVSVNSQGSSKDYIGYDNVYDKGHLSPNDDFGYDINAESENMLYTNCAPQCSQLNRGIWKSLEEYINGLVKVPTIKNINIWTGCIYDNSNKKIGKLIVPTFYWKLIKYTINTKDIYESYKIPNIIPKSNNFNDYKVKNDEFLDIINKLNGI